MNRRTVFIAALLAASAPALARSIHGRGTGGPAINTTCPTTGLVASTGLRQLTANCTISGAVTLTGTASLTMTGATLTIAGAITLSNNAALVVQSGGLVISQTTMSGQYPITLNNNSTFQISNSSMVTSSNGVYRSATLNANDDSLVNVDTSTMTAGTGSWLLGNFFNRSRLVMKNAHEIPQEIYPNDFASINIDTSSFAGIWLNFLAGSNGVVNLPTKDGGGNINFKFGQSTGFYYLVDMKTSAAAIGLNSYPSSTMTVNGNGSTNDARLTIGYYVQDHTGPVGINDLPVSAAVTQSFMDQGRHISLNNAYLGPYTWQVYVQNSNGFLTTVTNSFVNEAAALTNGKLDIVGGTLQLAQLTSAGAGAVVNVTGGTHLWDQGITAQQGGKINLTDCTLHGNAVIASGAGSDIVFTNCSDAKNGTQATCTGNPPPNTAGMPLCHPQNPLQACATYSALSSGTITPNPVTCAGGTPTLPVNTALPSLTGALNMGATLTGNVGTWTGSPTPTFACKLFINDLVEKVMNPCDNGAAQAKFFLKNYYAGEVPSLQVTATNSAGSAAATSAPTPTAIVRAPTQAVRANDFNDTIGAVTHMNETGSEYWSTVGRSYSYTNIATALTYLPYMYHLRGGWGYRNNANLIHTNFPPTKVVVDFVCCDIYNGPNVVPGSDAYASRAWVASTSALPAVEAIQAGNEVDSGLVCPMATGTTFPASCPAAGDFAASTANIKNNQQIYWAQFGLLLPVMSPSLQDASKASLYYGTGTTGVNPSNFTLVDEHHYTQFQGGTFMQWSTLYSNNDPKSSANGFAPVRGGAFHETRERPTVITEAGFMSCAAGRVSGSCSKNTPEATVAKLIPSMLLDAHAAGVYRTYLYQLLDQQKDPGTGLSSENYYHGIFSIDTTANYSPVSPKPAATSLKNMMNFMHDAGGTADTFTPGTWSYSLTGLPNSGSTAPYQKGQSLLFQRSDGKFILAVWDDVVIWNFAAGVAMTGVPALTHPILAPGTVPSAVSQYDPITNTTTTLTPSASMTLNLPDHPIFLLITP